jgi:uncharacterized protein YdhG (YjbR/CyaY superfamily)
MADDPRAYFDRLPPDRRAALEAVRALIFQVVPDVVESMHYRMPTYERPGGHVLCSMASQKHYMSLYMDPRLVAQHKDALAHLSVGKSCIRFKRLENLPLDAVRAMLEELARRSPSL